MRASGPRSEEGDQQAARIIVLQQLIGFVLPVLQLYRLKLKTNAAASDGVAVMVGPETGLSVS